MDEQTQKLLDTNNPEGIAKSYEANTNSVDEIMNRSRNRTNSICSSKSFKQKEDFAKNAIENFRIKLVDGMEPNQTKMKLNLENSLMLVTAIVPKVGYERAAEIANLAFKESLNLKEATLKLGYLKEDEFDEAMNINSMI